VTEVATGAAACGFVSLLALSELAARRWSLRPESARKLAHVSCGVLAAALPVALDFSAIAVLAGAFVPFMLVSRRVGLFPIVHGGERTTHGEIYFPLGVLLTAVAVPERAPYVFGVLVLALADAAAGLLGERFGRRSYRLLGAHKTYVGSACFFVTTAALAVALDPSFAAPAIAAALTIEEGLLGGGADNVVLPVSAAALLEAFA
jgi:phytol kinase